MERLTKRLEDGQAIFHECHGTCGTCDGANCCCIGPMVDRLAAYEDSGLEPEEIADFMKRWEQAVEIGGMLKKYGIDHIWDIIQAEQDGRLVELPFVAMVEQSLQDGKMKPLGDQKHNGRYAVVYVDRNKWKSPLIDICGKPYDREEAEARMAVLAKKGGTHEDSGSL